MRLAWTLVLAACAVTACRSVTYGPPPGCIVSSADAITLGDEFLAGQSLDWGDAKQVSFDGRRFLVTYETPAGQAERALLVDCQTAGVQFFVP
jgi:hypothetical protein